MSRTNFSRLAIARRPALEGRESRFGRERDRQIRTEIAQAAAKLIMEHGLDDWTKAKRKAARQLGVNEQSNLPSSEELEQAIREYNNLFRPESQGALLYARRKAALDWMRRLIDFSPRLTAGVATGLASAHSEIRIELAADSAKQVELFLLGHGIDFDPLPTRQASEDCPQYRIVADDAAVRLVVIPLAQRRNVARDRADERLNIDAVEALLAAGP
jgi:predicted nucleotidyltransferase